MTPILDEPTWQRLQDVMDARSYRQGRWEERLASNVAVCGVCGSPLVGSSEGRRDPEKAPRYVYCCKKRPAQPNACGSISASSADVDAVIGEKVCDFLADSARVAALLRHVAPGPEMDALHAREQELTESLLAVEQALRPPPGVPRMPLDRYYKAVAEIEVERREVHRRLAVNREASLLAEALDFGEDATPEWEARPMAWRRAILKLITKRIEVRPAPTGGVPGRRGARFDPSRVVVTFADEG